MSSAAGRQHRDAVHHLTDWIALLAPCEFAPGFAKPSSEGIPARMHFIAAEPDFSAEQLTRAETMFDMAGAEKKFAGIVWPHVRTPGELLDALLVLLESERWQCQVVPWGQTHAREQDMLLALQWRTAAGELSSVMGFTPHGSMPVPRRSPYAAVVWWPGPRSNPHVTHPQPHIGFIDGDHTIADPGRYVAARKSSTARTQQALAHAPEDIKRFREVAFCLPREDVMPRLDRLHRSHSRT